MNKLMGSGNLIDQRDSNFFDVATRKHSYKESQMNNMMMSLFPDIGKDYT